MAAVIEADGSHRPWPRPAGAWRMAMRWHVLLFAHWPVRADLLRPLVPPGLEIDTHSGDAWIGVIPFRMTGVRPRGVPALPWVSAFPELNVRTYVTASGKPGVWFFSLDAGNRLAVEVARRWFHLPYYHARMRTEERAGWVEYESRRKGEAVSAQRSAISNPPEFAGRYRACGEVYRSQRGSLEHFLTERYCLYAADGRKRLYRAEIDHAPWPLQPAAAEIRVNTMTAPLGISLPDMAPVLHFARRLDVVAWRLRRV